MTPSTISTNVELAETDGEKEEIYRLRYYVYVEQMGGGPRLPDAHHATHQVRDALDETAHHFYVRQEGRIVACLRHNQRRDGALECESEFLMERLAPAYPDHVSLSSRVLLHPRLRSSAVLKDLLCAVYRFMRAERTRFDFIECHTRLLPFYSHLGHRVYRAGFRHPKQEYVIPMVLVVNDVDHLQRSGSPLAAVTQSAGDPADRELLFRQFPEAAQEYVSVDMDQAAFWDLMRTRLLDRDATIARQQIFDGLTETEMRTIASLGHVVGSRDGDSVVIGREPGREMFLILDGTYRIVAQRDAGEPPRNLKVLGPGDIFGELAFLTNGLRSASVVAMAEGRLLVLNAKALDHLTTRDPKTAAKFFRNLAAIVATRMRDAVKL